MTEDTEAQWGGARAARGSATPRRLDRRRSGVCTATFALLVAAVAGCGSTSGAPGTPAIVSPSISPPSLTFPPAPTPTPSPTVAPFDPSSVDALELIELYAQLGDVDPADANQHVGMYLNTVETGLASYPSQTVQYDAGQLIGAVTAMLNASLGEWESAATTVARDAEDLDLDLANLYPAPLGATAATILTETGSGDTRSAWLKEGPYPVEDQLEGASEVEVHFTGQYTFTWSVGQGCVAGGWGFERVLPPLGLPNNYLATSGNVPPDAPSGSRTVLLLAGELAVQTDFFSGPTACAWQYTISGPVAGT